MNILHWFHHLVNPHCVACREDAQEEKVCVSCETLKMQLSIANNEKKQLLESILSLTEKPKETVQPTVNLEALRPKAVTWSVRRQMLEAEDRKQAQLLAEQKKHAEEAAKQVTRTPISKEQEDSINELEKELGVGVELGIREGA